MSTRGGYPVFANPPVKHVVLEVRFPSTTVEPAVADAGLRAGLHDQFPLGDRASQQTLAVDLGGGGTQMQMVELLRYQSRDRTRSVAVSPEAVTIETTEYLGFDWYLNFVRKPLAVVAEVLSPDGILSLGHRFIDEVRVSDESKPIDWSRWIDARLLAPSLVPVDAGLDAPAGWLGSMSYQTSPEMALTLRYGPMQGSGLLALGAVGVPGPSNEEPFFLLDWDSRWTPRTAPEFSAAAVIEHCKELYRPVRRMFHHLITDDLREVLSVIPEERNR